MHLHLKNKVWRYKYFILIKYFYHQAMYDSIYFPKYDKVKHFDTLIFNYPAQNLLPQNI